MPENSSGLYVVSLLTVNLLLAVGLGLVKSFTVILLLFMIDIKTFVNYSLFLNYSSADTNGAIWCTFMAIHRG